MSAPFWWLRIVRKPPAGRNSNTHKGGEGAGLTPGGTASWVPLHALTEVEEEPNGPMLPHQDNTSTVCL